MIQGPESLLLLQGWWDSCLVLCLQPMMVERIYLDLTPLTCLSLYYLFWEHFIYSVHTYWTLYLTPCAPYLRGKVKRKKRLIKSQSLTSRISHDRERTWLKWTDTIIPLIWERDVKSEEGGIYSSLGDRTRLFLEEMISNMTTSNYLCWYLLDPMTPV